MKLKGAITGTPRSGTTILTAMLNQHPDLYVPFTSPMVNLLWNMYLNWENRDLNMEFSSPEVRGACRAAFRGFVDGFYQGCSPKRYALDKHVSWAIRPNREIYHDLFGEDLKLVYIRRPISQIEESYKKLLKDSSCCTTLEEITQLARELFHKCQSEIEYRPDSWLIIEYDDWINDPKQILQVIEKFLDLKPFKYDFNHPKINTEDADRILKNRILNNTSFHIVRPMQNAF